MERASGSNSTSRDLATKNTAGQAYADQLHAHEFERVCCMREVLYTYPLT